MSKAIRKPLVAAAAVLLCSGAVQATELAVNGGFETGDFSGWTQFVNGGTQSIVDVNASECAYAASLNATADAPIDTLIKNANIGIGQVSPGQAITISFDARGATANGGVAFAEFFSELAGGGTSAAEILGNAPLALNANPDVWTSFLFATFAGPDVSGGVTLQLKAACAPVAGCISDVYFDNISVSVSAVPVPAALWLFGSALGLLGWAKRRVV